MSNNPDSIPLRRQLELNIKGLENASACMDQLEECLMVTKFHATRDGVAKLRNAFGVLDEIKASNQAAVGQFKHQLKQIKEGKADVKEIEQVKQHTKSQSN